MRFVLLCTNEDKSINNFHVNFPECEKSVVARKGKVIQPFKSSPISEAIFKPFQFHSLRGHI